MTIERAYPRKKRRFQVRFTDENGVSRLGFTHDVSLSGAFVTAGSLPQIGQNLSLELRDTAGRSICFAGVVVRQKRAPLALSATMPNGFGLGLTELSEDYRELVLSL